MRAAIEWDNIAELLWAAPAAGLAVSLTFSLLVLGIARAGDAQRDGSGGAAAAYSVLAVVSGAAFIATVVFAVALITSK